MIQVHFIPEDLLVEAPAGTPLIDIAEAASADLTFGCRSGSCGTCLVRIADGLDHCSAMTPEERDFLSGLDVSPDHRLACQVTLSGNATIDSRVEIR